MKVPMLYMDFSYDMYVTSFYRVSRLEELTVDILFYTRQGQNFTT